MQVRRICKAAHRAEALSGVGAEKFGGRWNLKGDRMVYMSSNLSLACLEIFVHLGPNPMPDGYYSIEATIPDALSFEELTEASLPRNWREFPSPSALENLGSTWLREQRSVALIVPSAVNPEETNILLNPNHPEFADIKITDSKPFRFNPRMWK